MKRKLIAGLASSMLLVSMLGTAASAQDGPLWEEGDIIDSDEQHVVVAPAERPVQEAAIELEGPEALLVGEVGEYTVTVTNLSGDIDLGSWKLGLGVANIDDVDDVTITYSGSSADLTDGTPGVDVSIADNVLYLRGSNDPVIKPGEESESSFDVEFHRDGLFTGAAYVIDEGKTLYVADNQPDYYPYYDVDGGTNTSKPPMKPRHMDDNDLRDDYQCSFNRLAAREAEGTPTLRQDNWVQCYDRDNGEVFYWHYIVMAEDGDPIWDTLVTRGAVASDLGLDWGRTWRLVSFNASYGGEVHSIDTTDRDAIEEWASFPEPSNAG